MNGRGAPRPAVVSALLLHATLAAAGHGMLNSFAGIEWLPEPGLTPDSMTYPFDGWRERADLRLTGVPTARVDLALRFAREKLAETRAMVIAGNAAAARRAITAYRAHLARACAAAREIADPARQAAVELVATALLEHQYIMSTEYVDLPRGTRPVIAHIIATAQARYGELARELPRRRRDALFFKEEEVRWSWDMALAADEQGL